MQPGCHSVMGMCISITEMHAGITCRGIPVLSMPVSRNADAAER